MTSTSIDAYEAVKPHIQALHTRILSVIKERNGATASEIEAVVGGFHKTLVNRISELKAFGMVTHTDVKRRNARGRSEAVIQAL